MMRAWIAVAVIVAAASAAIGAATDCDPVAGMQACTADGGRAAVANGAPCYWDAGLHGGGESFIAYPDGTRKEVN